MSLALGYVYVVFLYRFSVYMQENPRRVHIYTESMKKAMFWGQKVRERSKKLRERF